MKGFFVPDPQRFARKAVLATMTKHKLPLRPAALIGAAAFALLVASPAAAQRVVTLGLGAQAAPKYPGADNYGIGPLPIFDLRRPGEPITSSPYLIADGVKVALNPPGPDVLRDVRSLWADVRKSDCGRGR